MFNEDSNRRKITHSYYLFNCIYFVNLSVYFSKNSAKSIDKTAIIKYQRNNTVSVDNDLLMDMVLCDCAVLCT